MSTLFVSSVTFGKNVYNFFVHLSPFEKYVHIYFVCLLLKNILSVASNLGNSKAFTVYCLGSPKGELGLRSSPFASDNIKLFKERKVRKFSLPYYYMLDKPSM